MSQSTQRVADAPGSNTNVAPVLPFRDSPPVGKADAWDELNHLDDSYLEFSLASDILRGVSLCMAIFCLAFAAFAATIPIDMMASGERVWGLLLLALIPMVLLSLFLLRFDLRLPTDRPVRFNRRKRKVYVNQFVWSYNPFGRWYATADVLEWDRVQAEVTKQVSASGEVITQRYALELVERDPGTGDVAKRVRLQQGGQTTKQFEEQWEFIRRYMNEGSARLPAQHMRDQEPSFVDCLLFCMPWFAPTGKGQATRSRMGAGYWIVALLVSLLFPLWLVFGLGNYAVMRFAPEAVWPDGMDEASRG